MADDGNPQTNNSRVRLAEVRRDVQHASAAIGELADAVKELRAEQRRGQEKQTAGLSALQCHLDGRFEALHRAVANVTQRQAVFEACAQQWRTDHETRHTEHGTQHERDHADQARKSTIIDVVSALAAAIAGILIQPGAGS